MAALPHCLPASFFILQSQ